MFTLLVNVLLNVIFLFYFFPKLKNGGPALASAMAGYFNVIILFVIFGGIETFWGAMLGAAVLSLLPDLFRFLKDWYLFMYGLLFVLLMIFRPQGVLDRAALRALRKKLWR